MDQQKIENLLKELAEKTVELPPVVLSEEINKRIPESIRPLRATVVFNIVINLRVGKLAAAAAIILTMVLCANLFERSDLSAGSIYNDCKLFLTYRLAGGSNELALAKTRYQYLLDKGKEVFFYGQSIDPKNSNAILLQWKLSDSNYRVIFARNSFRGRIDKIAGSDAAEKQVNTV
jgi:hypothetical protein